MPSEKLQRTVSVCQQESFDFHLQSCRFYAQCGQFCTSKNFFIAAKTVKLVSLCGVVWFLHTHTHTNTCMHAHMHAHTHAHVRTHAHRHIHVIMHIVNIYVNVSNFSMYWHISYLHNRYLKLCDHKLHWALHRCTGF